jgi:hypothetical protein
MISGATTIRLTHIETVILLRVQYFQQRRRRVPVKIAVPNFVYLVEQDDWV